MMPAIGNVVGFHWGGMLFGLLAWGLVTVLISWSLARLFSGAKSQDDPATRSG